MKNFKITTQEDFNDCLMWISDLYKDAYGFRPRTYNFEAFTFQELTDFVNDLSEMCDREREAEEAWTAKCTAEFRNKFEALMEEQGVGYHTALEWMFDGFIAEEGLDWYSVESFGYHHGIQHTELGRKLEKDINKLVQDNPKKYFDHDNDEEVVDQEEILNKQYNPLFS